MYLKAMLKPWGADVVLAGVDGRHFGAVRVSTTHVDLNLPRTLRHPRSVCKRCCLLRTALIPCLVVRKVKHRLPVGR